VIHLEEKISPSNLMVVASFYSEFGISELTGPIANRVNDRGSEFPRSQKF
jgi:hypothetical protein